MSGIAGSGSASGMWPTTSTPSSLEAEQRRQDDRQHQYDERRRHLRRQPAERDQHRERARADRDRRGVDVAELAHQVVERREEVAVAGVDTPAGSAAGRPRSPSRARTGSRSSPASTQDRRSRRSGAVPPSTRTTATTSASAADSAAKRATSPPASGPTVAAETAEVAVVALTMSCRDVPSSPNPSIAHRRRHQPRLRRQPGDICA